MPAPKEKPTVGRVVHWREERDPRCRAALVIDVSPLPTRAGTSATIVLRVFTTGIRSDLGDSPVGSEDCEFLVEDDDPNWHWPERT